MDLTLVWGWQGGAYIGKLTHWVFALTTVFLFVGALVELGVPIKTFKFDFMYFMIAETLFVDIGFYVVEVPRLRKEFNKHSWIGTHKHFFNLIWILAIAAEHHPRQIQTGARLVKFGFLAPSIFHLVYYIFARIIAHPSRGKRFLRVLGIPQPEPNKTEPELWKEKKKLSER